MKMLIFYYDFESFWSDTHSLTKMNAIEYVMHEDTEIQVLSYAFGDDPVQTLIGEPAIAGFFDAHDWSDTLMVAHNGNGFDHMITAWRFGVKPKAWGCTLAMSRPFYALTVGGSLKALARALNLQEKGSLEKTNTRGKRVAQFTAEECDAIREYGAGDTEICRGLYKYFAPMLSMTEHRLIDLTFRMIGEPTLVADVQLLETKIKEERKKKSRALLELAVMTGVYHAGMSKDVCEAAMRAIVMSQPQFAALLEQLGATVPMKESPSTPGKMIPALAKSDDGMQELLEHENPLVATAAQVRLGEKSTQLETRMKTFLTVANRLDGKLPFPMNYCGAGITWRMGGTMAMNMLNLPRVDEKKPVPADVLRGSVTAPDGYVVVAVDSSNIELRVAHALAGQMDTVQRLHNKEDLYCWFASFYYGREITKADVNERFIGKVAMLQLQFGAGWSSFQNMLRIAAIKDKTIVVPTEAGAKGVVDMWRKLFPKMADRENGIWTRSQSAIEAMFLGKLMQIDEWGFASTAANMILTPERHWLQYPQLRRTMNANGMDEWVYGEGRNKARLYGPKLFQNIVQHLARIIVLEQTLVLNKYYPVKMSTYDEAGFLAPEDRAEQAAKEAVEIFSQSPKWWPELPVSAAAGFGKRYSDCK